MKRSSASLYSWLKAPGGSGARATITPVASVARTSAPLRAVRHSSADETGARRVSYVCGSTRRTSQPKLGIDGEPGLGWNAGSRIGAARNEKPDSVCLVNYYCYYYYLGLKKKKKERLMSDLYF